MHTHNLRERNYSYNYVASIVFIQAYAKQSKRRQFAVAQQVDCVDRGEKRMKNKNQKSPYSVCSKRENCADVCRKI